MNDFEIMKHICEVSEVERIKQGKTLKQWSAMLGMTLSSYKRSISLENSKYDLFPLIRLSEATGYSMDDICGLKSKKINLTNYQKEMAEAVYHYIQFLKEKEGDK